MGFYSFYINDVFRYSCYITLQHCPGPLTDQRLAAGEMMF